MKAGSFLKIEKLLFLSLFFLYGSTTYAVDPTEKYAVFIVGTGRSGTSCLSGVLQILGLSFGNNLCGPNQWNEKGGFEHQPTTDLLTAMMRMEKMDRFFPRCTDWDHSPHRGDYIEQVKKLFLSSFKGKTFCVKHPYMSLFLPLFTQAAQNLGYTVKIIVAMRDPREVTQSFKTRWPHMTNEQIGDFLAAYLSSILSGIGDNEMITVWFNDLLNRLDETIISLRQFIPSLTSQQEVEEQLLDFIDANLKHHNQ